MGYRGASCRKAWRRYLVLGLVLGFSASTNVQARDPEPKIYSPNPVSRRHQPSVELQGSWADYIRFVARTREVDSNYFEILREVMDPSYAKGIDGFSRMEDTRWTIAAYELRLREAVDWAENILEQKGHVRFVLDSSRMLPFVLPEKEELESWNERQLRYFFDSYDVNGDGKVDEEDEASVNLDRQMGVVLWNRLQELKKKYKGRLELVLSPDEMVPADEDFNYPRIHHAKYVWIQLREKGSTRKWTAPVVNVAWSANATDAGIARKIKPASRSIASYLGGNEPEYAMKSRGHIQFGAVMEGGIKDLEAMGALIGPVESWIRAYQRGEHFDSVKVPDAQWPRVIFDDGYNSTLQAFFSEGQKMDGTETVDPIWVLTKILRRDDIELKKFYGTQFVFTHKPLARHLRGVLSKHLPDDFFIAVDSSHALQPWSALPELLFVPKTVELPGVFEGKAIENTPEIASELNWRENVMVYQGGHDLISRSNDKLHLKAFYMEYIDAQGNTTYALVWGSANASNNASRLSADALYLFKTRDPAFAKAVKPFFDSIRNDDRMRSFDESFIEQQVTENFFPHSGINRRFYQRFAGMLHNPRSHKSSLEKIISSLEKARPIPGTSGSAILKWLKWNLNYRQSASSFSWRDFYFITRISRPGAVISEDYLAELKELWTADIRVKRRQTTAKGTFTRLARSLTEKTGGIEEQLDFSDLDAADVQRHLLLERCADWLTKVRSGNSSDRTRHPVVGTRRRRSAR